MFLICKKYLEFNIISDLSVRLFTDFAVVFVAVCFIRCHGVVPLRMLLFAYLKLYLSEAG